MDQYVSSSHVAAGVSSEPEPVDYRQALRVALAAGFGYSFDSYAVNVFGMLSPLIGKDLGISVGTIGTIGSIFLAGYTLGTFGFGYLADRLGRAMRCGSRSFPTAPRRCSAA